MQQHPQRVTGPVAEARAMEPQAPPSTAHAEDGALSLLALATADAASGTDPSAAGEMQK